MNAPLNSTLINLINDDVKSITSERLSPIKKESFDNEEEEIDEEIPIFIGHIPRFVSGISQKTTCNDVIKALIDDELANTRTKFMQLKIEPKNYIISERFKPPNQPSIERVLERDEQIYDLWQNWGGNRCDVQFRLKINKDHEHSGKTKENKTKTNGIKKLLKKVLNQGEMIQKHLYEMSKTQRISYTQSDYEQPSSQIFSSWNNASDDELFLIIEHQDKSSNDSGVFINKDQKNNLLSSKEMSRDKKVSLHEGTKDQFTRASFKFELVHKEIRSQIGDMKEIIQKEHSFLRKIDKYSLDDTDRNFEDVGKNLTIIV